MELYEEWEADHINYNIEEYSPNELIQILEIVVPNEESILKKTNYFIEKFENENKPELSSFFKEAQEKLLENLPDTQTVTVVNNKTGEEETKDLVDVWFQDQNIPQGKNPIQYNKNTNRKQTIDVFDNNHFPMKDDRLGVNETFPVPVAQGQLNPNITNTYTRFINIDTAYRLNANSEGDNFRYRDLTSQHLSSYSSSNFTFDLNERLDKVLRLQLVSVNIPLSWYAIDDAYGTNTFAINDTIISIKSGNYSKIEIIDAIQTQLTLADPSYNITFDHINQKVTIGLKSNDILYFYKDEGVLSSSNGKKNYNLGWILGFRNSEYYSEVATDLVDGIYYYESESLIDITGTKYIYMVLDDFNNNVHDKGIVGIENRSSQITLPYLTKNRNFDLSYNDCVSVEKKPVPVIQQGNPRQITRKQQYSINQIIQNRQKLTKDYFNSPTMNNILAILPVNTDNLNSRLLIAPMQLETNIRIYFGPVNIERMKIRLLDDKGNVLNLNGADWSFTIVSTHLYQY
jgi:hypothetical protein